MTVSIAIRLGSMNNLSDKALSISGFENVDIFILIQTVGNTSKKW